MTVPQIVVGSGPSGVACAFALIARGHEVWMVDGGADLEPERAQRLVELGQRPPETWGGEASLWMREGTRAGARGLLKLVYGSAYPYRQMPGATPIEGSGVYVQSSMGKGGLSAAWGTAVMAHREQDMEGWPITTADLAPHYRAVLDFMPVAQGIDRLEEDFPTFKVTEPVPLSPQGKHVWAGLKTHELELERQGVKFGRSRLAINHAGTGRTGGCTLCGLCMYGCPYGLLYTSAQTVDLLREHPRFRYLPGYVVRQVEEHEGHVKVLAVRSDGQTESLTGQRVFVGAGVLATAAMVLRSLDAYDQPLKFLDSGYFMLPMLQWRGAPGFKRRDLHTMSQMFIEVLDDEVSRFAAHLQLYTYNDLFEQPIRTMLGPLAALFPWDSVCSRLTILQGFLHSSDSAGFEGRLQRDGKSDRLLLSVTDHPRGAEVLNRVLKKLWSVRRYTGMMPFTPMIQRGEPGRGFHTGGTFPMAKQPRGWESDLLGRPAGMRRLHVIDSSALPSIPGTTITYTVMANAHRIGVLAGSL